MKRRNQKWSHRGLRDTQRDVFERGEAERTVNELGEMSLCDRVAAVETDFNVVAMPIGAEMCALVVDVDEGCSKAYVASARARGGLWDGRRSFGGQGGGRLGYLGEDISRGEGIEEVSWEREQMVVVVMRHC